MSELDREIAALIKMIEASGGVAGIDKNAPDFVKRAFIEMVLKCPDCQDAMKSKGKVQ